MNPTALLQLIPALWRDRLYGAYVLVGFIFGAIQVGFAAVPDATQPSWLLPALAVYAYVGTLFVGTAKANVTSLSGPPPAPADPPAPGQQGAADTRQLLWFALLVVVVVVLIAVLF